MAASVDVDPPHFTAALRGGAPPVLVLVGELDMAAEPQVQVVAGRLWAAPAPSAVQVDLSGLSFVDVGGLRVLRRLEDVASLAGVSVSWVGVTPRARRVMELAGFDAWRKTPPAAADDRR